MPPREKQLEYLFRANQDLFYKGLTKARAEGPERAAAFAAGFVYGRTHALRNHTEHGAFDAELAAAYWRGIEVGEQSFEPPKWLLKTPLTVAPQDEPVESLV